MSQSCGKCGALKWQKETKGMCCSNGKVSLPTLTSPEPLQTLLKRETAESRHFLDNMRKYNSCFQMTRFGADKEVTEHGYMPTFKVQGQVYHTIGSLLPMAGKEAKFLQIYFIGDPKDQAKRQGQVIPGTRLPIIHFKYAFENDPGREFDIVINPDKVPSEEHRRRFNAPVVSEVAAVISGYEKGQRDIVIRHRNNELERISSSNRAYDGPQYPLIYTRGENGYYWQIYKQDSGGGPIEKKVTAMEFYAYHLMLRLGSSDHLFRERDLFHQFLVDMYAKIESERLAYIVSHQKELRVYDYAHLRDSINNDAAHGHELGKMVILPATFTGGPRYMQEKTKDALTYVKHYGRPDLFITFTCNPKWAEITAELLPGQASSNRHDIIARVFRQKIVKIIDLFTKYNIFDLTRCDMYSIEWQKRGLPHAHILLWLQQKLRPAQIDSFISAELPSQQEDPELHDIIKSHMVHGPCGRFNPNSPCMKDGKCTKNYPKRALKETQTGRHGYPLYKRRKLEDGGSTAKINFRLSGQYQEVEIDNQ
ncbi:uncharacterized protein LOC134193517 [Corticium candelabrum]|uniref:uncharacterized protein LOC134193517 n=1 Tax=Corticium candelabrum TaxID=121492 RepID=UPI002E255CA7|nr:uncharacterized protein LOC134193517 [Corticium candelabrum]